MVETTLSKRETFATYFGAIMTMLGTAVGLGNVWRFPYMMGKYGGAAFLLIYALIVLLVGIPALMAEMALGRATRAATGEVFDKIGFPLGKYVGPLIVLGFLALSPYYAVVSGWLTIYLIATWLGLYANVDVGDFFNMVLQPHIQIVGLLSILIPVYIVIYFGVKKGIERVSKYMMPLFYVLFIGLIVYALTLPGAGKGLEYYLTPKPEQVEPMTFVAAMGQAFFSLSLGGLFILTYGSYLRDNDDIPLTATYTAFGDTLAAFLAGLVIFPIAFSFGIEPGSGPGLMFLTLPSVFKVMPGGFIYGGLLLLAVWIAVFLSDIASFEVMTASLMDRFGWSRKKSLTFAVAAQFILALPVIYSLEVLEICDLILGSLWLPLGSILAIIGFTRLGKEKVLEEINKGAKVLRLGPWIYYWIKIAIPLAIVLIAIYLLIG